MTPGFRTYWRRLWRRAAVAGLLATWAVAWAVGPAAALGLALGVLTSLVLLRQQAVQQLGCPVLVVGRARLGGGALLRTGVRALALAGAYRRPELAFAWTVCGLFWGHAALLADHFMYRCPAAS